MTRCEVCNHNSLLYPDGARLDNGIIMYCMYIPYNGREFHDFVLKQAFCGINFAFCICVLIYSVVMILQINLCKLGQIAKNMKV